MNKWFFDSNLSCKFRDWHFKYARKGAQNYYVPFLQQHLQIDTIFLHALSISLGLRSSSDSCFRQTVFFSFFLYSSRMKMTFRRWSSSLNPTASSNKRRWRAITFSTTVILRSPKKKMNASWNFQNASAGRISTTLLAKEKGTSHFWSI